MCAEQADVKAAIVSSTSSQGRCASGAATLSRVSCAELKKGKVRAMLTR